MELFLKIKPFILTFEYMYMVCVCVCSVCRFLQLVSFIADFIPYYKCQ
jgi:hypothetical protein